jgi:hypothetical protein
MIQDNDPNTLLAFNSSDECSPGAIVEMARACCIGVCSAGNSYRSFKVTNPPEVSHRKRSLRAKAQSETSPSPVLCAIPVG